jgi:hypothetical protein
MPSQDPTDEILGIDGRLHSAPANRELEVERTWIPIRALPERPEFTPEDSDELRFTLKELFLAITVSAAMLALFRSLGIYGAVLSFLAAAIVTLFVIPQMFPRDVPRQRLFFDFVWGMVMPAVCLVFDPVVFKQGDFEGDPLLWMDDKPAGKMEIAKHAYYAWPLLAGEIATLGAVLLLGKKLRPIAPLVAGALFIGFMAALCLAVLLSPLAAIATLFLGIGLLGFTPVFTCWTYLRRMRLMWFIAKGDRPNSWQLAFAVLGIAICLASTWLAGLLALMAVPIASPAREILLP